MTPFENFDLADFWKEDPEFAREYLGEPLTDELLAGIEDELGFKLPAAYVALMRRQNGGLPARTGHRTASPTSWASDHVAVTGIFGIGRGNPSTLGGNSGSEFWIDEWGYPPIGVYFADCPSAGHDMLCLDYRKCVPGGEPQVVHVDQEYDYRITFVAENFDAFIRGLYAEEL